MFNLFARKNDPETSQETVKAIGAGGMATKITKSLYLHKKWRLTSPEIADEFQCNRDSVSPLLPVLERKGIVQRSGYVRKVGSRKQIIWRLSTTKDCFNPLVGDEKAKDKKKRTSRAEAIELIKKVLIEEDSLPFGCVSGNLASELREALSNA